MMQPHLSAYCPSTTFLPVWPHCTIPDETDLNSFDLGDLKVTTGRHAGMTRIGTHRHASAPNLTTSTWQNRGRGIKVQFQGVNTGQTAGKVSKQMDSCRRPARQDKTTSSQGAGQSLNAPQTKLTKSFTTN